MKVPKPLRWVWMFLVVGSGRGKGGEDKPSRRAVEAETAAAEQHSVAWLRVCGWQRTVGARRERARALGDLRGVALRLLGLGAHDHQRGRRIDSRARHLLLHRGGRHEGRREAAQDGAIAQRVSGGGWDSRSGSVLRGGAHPRQRTSDSMVMKRVCTAKANRPIPPRELQSTSFASGFWRAQQHLEVREQHHGAPGGPARRLARHGRRRQGSVAEEKRKKQPGGRDVRIRANATIGWRGVTER